MWGDEMDRGFARIGIVVVAILFFSGCDMLTGYDHEPFEVDILASDVEWGGSFYVHQVEDDRIDGLNNTYMIEIQPSGYEFWVDLDSYEVPGGPQVYYVGIYGNVLQFFCDEDLSGGTLRFTPIPWS